MAYRPGRSIGRLATCFARKAKAFGHVARLPPPAASTMMVSGIPAHAGIDQPDDRLTKARERFGSPAIRSGGDALLSLPGRRRPPTLYVGRPDPGIASESP